MRGIQVGSKKKRKKGNSREALRLLVKWRKISGKCLAKVYFVIYKRPLIGRGDEITHCVTPEKYD